jgi:hypothetical protein
MIEVKSPNHIRAGLAFSVFLAGSIEMGKAENWQERFVRETKDIEGIVYNPRRDDWDSTWVQSIDNPQFREQVEWELEKLETANVIVFYFDPNTMSPVTMLELGLHVRSSNIYICCPPGFWRKGNVDIVCAQWHIPMFENFDDLIEKFKNDFTRPGTW